MSPHVGLSWHHHSVKHFCWFSEDSWNNQLLHLSVFFSIKISSTFHKNFKKSFILRTMKMWAERICLAVVYLPCEINCIPVELRYEMFRSTAEDWLYRNQADCWMDCAIIDYVTYLFFYSTRCTCSSTSRQINTDLLITLRRQLAMNQTLVSGRRPWIS